MIQDMAKNKPDPEVLKANRSVYGWMFLRRNLDKEEYAAACNLSKKVHPKRQDLPFPEDNQMGLFRKLECLGLIAKNIYTGGWFINYLAIPGREPSFEKEASYFENSHFTAACDDFHYEL